MKIIIKLYILSCFQKKDGNIYTRHIYTYIRNQNFEFIRIDWLTDQ